MLHSLENIGQFIIENTRLNTLKDLVFWYIGRSLLEKCKLARNLAREYKSVANSDGNSDGFLGFFKNKNFGH